jgi:hypothetical protein
MSQQTPNAPWAVAEPSEPQEGREAPGAMLSFAAMVLALLSRQSGR